MDAERILFLVAVISFTTAAAVVDVRSRTIPNWLTVPAFLAGVTFHAIHSGWYGIGLSLGGFATGFSILLVLMAVGGGGGGDVKLMGALGAWLGWKAFLAVFVLGTVFVVLGSALVVIIQALSRQTNTVAVPNAADGSPKSASRPDSRMQMTYALPVALATWLVLAWIMTSNRTGLFDQPAHGMTENQTHQEGLQETQATDVWNRSFQTVAAATQFKAW